MAKKKLLNVALDDDPILPIMKSVLKDAKELRAILQVPAGKSIIEHAREIMKPKQTPNCSVCKWCKRGHVFNFCEAQAGWTAIDVYNSEACRQLFQLR
jgi:hypothetical protein